MTNEAFERDLRVVLAGLAPTEVPRELHVHVGHLASRPASTARKWLPRLGSMALGFAVVAVAIVAGAVALNVLRTPAPLPPGSILRPLVWSTELASLEAAAITIEAGGRVLDGSADRFSVTSDPGTATYRTLEITWVEQGSEMRLNLYFAADETHWWVSEIRTYDGMPTPDWITYRGEFFKSERGSAYEGTVQLTGSGRTGGGRLHIDHMRLAAFAPGTGPWPFEGCETVPEQPGRADGRDPQGPMGGLVGLEARDAHALLVERGICHDFRLSWQYADHLNQGYSQRWCTPPPGKVSETALGSRGELVLFIEDPAPRTFDPSTPGSVGC